MLGKTASAFDVELRLLLACSSLCADKSLIQTLAGRTRNWEKVVRSAQRHGLLLQLCQRLEEATESLSTPVSELVKIDIRQITQQNLLLTAELLRLMQALAEQKIRAIPYKGPILAATYYGNLGMREFCDLDILVSEKDLPRVLKIMPQLDYRAEYSLTPAQEARYLSSTCEYNFVHGDSRAPVEIHWQVIPPRFGLRFEFERLWSRARIVQIADSRLPVLSPEDTLLVLSVHGFKHLWECLKWVCDLANLLSAQEDLDWNYIEREADRIGALRIVRIALSLASLICDSRLPDPIHFRLRRDPIAVSIAREIINCYVRDCSMSRIRARFLMLRAYTGFRHRVMYIARSLFDPTMEELIVEPERSMAVLRAQHIFRVVRQVIFHLSRK